MENAEFIGLIDFLRGAEQLKNTLHRCYSSEGLSEGKNPDDFDYRYNLQYGSDVTRDYPLIAADRDVLDQETERRAQESEAR